MGGGEGMTLIIKLSGGVDTRIRPVMVIFKDKNCSCPIHGLRDNIEDIAYRLGPKGWMDQRVFLEWPKEPKCNKPRDNRTRLVCMSTTLEPQEEGHGVRTARLIVNESSLLFA